MQNAKCLLLLVILLSNFFAQFASAQTLNSREGFQKIVWQDDFAEFSHLVLLQGSESYVYPLTQGQHLTISGLPDGHYKFYGKNKSTGEMQLVDMRLTVEHYPLNIAFSLFVMGLAVFAYLIVLLRQYSRLEYISPDQGNG